MPKHHRQSLTLTDLCCYKLTPLNAARWNCGATGPLWVTHFHSSK